MIHIFFCLLLNCLGCPVCSTRVIMRVCAVEHCDSNTLGKTFANNKNKIHAFVQWACIIVICFTYIIRLCELWKNTFIAYSSFHPYRLEFVLRQRAFISSLLSLLSCNIFQKNIPSHIFTLYIALNLVTGI